VSRERDNCRKRHGRGFNAENSSAEVDALPSGRNCRGHLGIGETTLGPDGKLRGEWLGKVV
jgi:hypothetical protein